MCVSWNHLQILHKASSLREAAERSREDSLGQLQMHQKGLEALQEKLKTAVDQIHKGNEVCID